ncbi:MAG TPA: redoxin domain-containing protein, partial [Bacteroidales bacterium]|nr:redoxin domain-containing protein [Bacteroidales bacterium]
MKTSIFFALCILFSMSSWSQDTKVPQIGSKAPSFTALSTNGTIHFPKDYGRSWKILFSHPKDFTPVCSSEILELAYDQKDFDELNTKLVVMSTDVLSLHFSWKTALESLDYKGRPPVKINFPIVADTSYAISRAYGMIHNSESTTHNIRGVYFIDPDNRIRSIMFYPNEVGRNVEEIKRTLIALQTNYADNKIVTPANWEKGDDVLIPVISQVERENLNHPG